MGSSITDDNSGQSRTAALTLPADLSFTIHHHGTSPELSSRHGQPRRRRSEARQSATIRGRELVQGAPLIPDRVKGTSGMVLYAFIYAYQTNSPRGRLFDYSFSFVCPTLLLSSALHGPCSKLDNVIDLILIIWQGPPQPLIFWGLHSSLLLSNRGHSRRCASHSVLDHLPTLKLNDRQWSVTSRRNMTALQMHSAAPSTAFPCVTTTLVPVPRLLKYPRQTPVMFSSVLLALGLLSIEK